MADRFYSEVKLMELMHEFTVCIFLGLNEEWHLPFQLKLLLFSVSNYKQNHIGVLMRNQVQL